MQQQQIENAKVHTFYNNWKIEKKKLKVKSFNNYHLCALACYKNADASQSDFCVRSCQNDYEQYINYKRSIKVQDAQNFFYKIEFNQNEKDAQGQSLYYEYPRKVVDMEFQLQGYINNLKQYLNNQEKKYNDELKKK